MEVEGSLTGRLHGAESGHVEAGPAAPRPFPALPSLIQVRAIGDGHRESKRPGTDLPGVQDAPGFLLGVGSCYSRFMEKDTEAQGRGLDHSQ